MKPREDVRLKVSESGQPEVVKIETRVVKSPQPEIVKTKARLRPRPRSND
jgi:hypothetical protein